MLGMFKKGPSKYDIMHGILDTMNETVKKITSKGYILVTDEDHLHMGALSSYKEYLWSQNVPCTMLHYTVKDKKYIIMEIFSSWNHDNNELRMVSIPVIKKSVPDKVFFYGLYSKDNPSEVGTIVDEIQFKQKKKGVTESMEYVFEAKIVAKERKELPDEIFGLPSLRKFPLNDEAHVRKAIQFFKFCPQSRRNELANNINKRATELNMKINISKLSPFYKYAKKSIVQEGSLNVGVYDDYLADALYEKDADEIGDLIESIGTIASSVLNRMFMEAFTNASVEGLSVLERKVVEILTNDSLFANVRKQIESGEHSINPVFVINNSIKKIYNSIFSFIEYNESVNLEKTELLYEVMDDLFSFIKRSVYERVDNKEVIEKVKTITDIVDNYPANYYHVSRKFIEMSWELIIYIREIKSCVAMGGSESANFMDRLDKLITIQSTIDNAKQKILSNLNGSHVIFAWGDDTVVSVLNGGNMNMINSIKYLKILKTQIRDEMDAIFKSCDFIVRDESFHIRNFFLNNVACDNGGIYSTVSYLDGSIGEDNIKMYNKDLTMQLGGMDLLKLNETGLYERLHSGKDRDGNNIYYGVGKDYLYLITKDTTSDCIYYLLKFYDDGKQCVSENNMICDRDQFNKDRKLKAIKICFDSKKVAEPDFQSLTEGIELDSEGNIKFTFSPQKSFMDEYSENHKLLAMNANANNTEAMKINLAYHFAMINYIEREIMYNKESKLTKHQKDDAIKARMFAINDFKTYMKQVQKAEPGFDFTTYYQNSDFGKLTIEVKKDTLVGLKKLFRAIMMA